MAKLLVRADYELVWLWPYSGLLVPFGAHQWLARYVVAVKMAANTLLYYIDANLICIPVPPSPPKGLPLSFLIPCLLSRNHPLPIRLIQALVASN